MPDIINIEILPDGTLKLDTGKISTPNHISAENFFREVSKLTGGPVSRTHKHGHMHHTHELGEHAHQH